MLRSIQDFDSKSSTLANPENLSLNLLDLPDEILVGIFKEAIDTPIDALQLSRASRVFYRVSSDNKIWEEFAKLRGLGLIDKSYKTSYLLMKKTTRKALKCIPNDIEYSYCPDDIIKLAKLLIKVNELKEAEKYITKYTKHFSFYVSGSAVKVKLAKAYLRINKITEAEKFISSMKEGSLEKSIAQFKLFISDKRETREPRLKENLSNSPFVLIELIKISPNDKAINNLAEERLKDEQSSRGMEKLLKVYIKGNKIREVNNLIDLNKISSKELLKLASEYINKNKTKEAECIIVNMPYGPEKGLAIIKHLKNCSCEEKSIKRLISFIKEIKDLSELLKMIIKDFCNIDDKSLGVLSLGRYPACGITEDKVRLELVKICLKFDEVIEGNNIISQIDDPYYKILAKIELLSICFDEDAISEIMELISHQLASREDELRIKLIKTCIMQNKIGEAKNIKAQMKSPPIKAFVAIAECCFEK